MKKMWLLLENINKRSTSLVLLKCYHHLHLMAKFEVGCANQVIDENCNLGHFNRLLGQMIEWKNLSPKSCWFLLNRSQRNQMSFSMVGMHGTMFPAIDFLAHQILSILRSEIETKRIFSLMGILITLMKCLQLNNLEKLILWEKFDQMIVKLVVNHLSIWWS